MVAGASSVANYPWMADNPWVTNRAPSLAAIGDDQGVGGNDNDDDRELDQGEGGRLGCRIPPGRPEGWWAVRMRQVDIDVLAGEEDEERLELLQLFIESKVSH